MVTFLSSLVVIRLYHQTLDDRDVFYEICPFFCYSKLGCYSQNTNFVYGKNCNFFNCCACALPVESK